MENTNKGIAPRNIIGGLILLLIGMGVLGVTLYFRGQLRASLDWPSVPGVVVEFFVDEYRDANQDPSYYARVRYDYRVDGQYFRGGQVKFGIEKSFTGQRGAQKALEDYPVGQEVVVYYDPLDPTNAVIDRSDSQVQLFLWIGGGIALLGFAILLNSLFRK